MKRFMVFFLLTFLSAYIFFCSSAANQIHFRDITIEQLVRDSQIIVIAQKADPYITYERIQFQDKKCPAFTKTMYHLKVLKVLYDQERGKLEGKTITVLPADYDSNLYIHEIYYSKGISKSPIYQRFKAISDIEKDKYTIVFLNKRQDSDYEFSVQDSYLPWSQKKNVIQLVKTIKLKSPSD